MEVGHGHEIRSSDFTFDVRQRYTTFGEATEDQAQSMMKALDTFSLESKLPNYYRADNFGKISYWLNTCLPDASHPTSSENK